MAYRLCDVVVALIPIKNGSGEVCARPGTMGYVLVASRGFPPAVWWGAGNLCHCNPGVDVELVRHFDITFGKPAEA